jgi:hypothetical protein
MPQLWLLQHNDGTGELSEIYTSEADYQRAYLDSLFAAARKQWRRPWFQTERRDSFPDWMEEFLDEGAEEHVPRAAVDAAMCRKLHEILDGFEDVYWRQALLSISAEQLRTLTLASLDELDAGFMTEVVAAWQAKEA